MEQQNLVDELLLIKQFLIELKGSQLKIEQQLQKLTDQISKVTDNSKPKKKKKKKSKSKEVIIQEQPVVESITIESDNHGIENGTTLESTEQVSNFIYSISYHVPKG